MTKDQEFEQHKQKYWKMKDILERVLDADKKDQATLLLRQSLTTEDIEKMQENIWAYNTWGFGLFKQPN